MKNLKVGVEHYSCRFSDQYMHKLTSSACTAYSRYVLDIGQSEDWLALQIALLPCLLGYSTIAQRLKALQPSIPASTANRYTKWIDNYVADDYSEAVRSGCGEPIRVMRSCQGPELTYSSHHRETRISSITNSHWRAGTDICARYQGKESSDCAVE
jgi:hypothetical protein